MAAMPTAVAANKTAPANDTIDVRWGWWPGSASGIGLGLLGATIAAPYYYGYPHYYDYPYGYGGYYGYPSYAYGGFYPRPYWGWRHYGWHHGWGWRRHYAYYR